MSRFVIIGGTARGDVNLCDSCKNHETVRFRAEENMSRCLQYQKYLTQPVVQCPRYFDRAYGEQNFYEMEEQAYIIVSPGSPDAKVTDSIQVRRMKMAKMTSEMMEAEMRKLAKQEAKDEIADTMAEIGGQA